MCNSRFIHFNNVLKQVCYMSPHHGKVPEGPGGHVGRWAHSRHTNKCYLQQPRKSNALLK